MSPPRRDWALRGRANFRSRAAPEVDALAARREWLGLARAIERTGSFVIALEADDAALTGMPYAAECGQVFPFDPAPGARSFFALPSMAAPHRRGERSRWAALARALDLEVVDAFEGPLGEGDAHERPIWEAQGDVAHFAGFTFLFYGGRTTRGGLEAVARRLGALGVDGFDASGALGPTQVALAIREPAFHGNMAFAPFEALGFALVCPDVFERASLERLRDLAPGRLVEIGLDEVRSYATNGLLVTLEGRATLLAPAVAPARVVGLLRERGVDVRTLDLRELCEKAGGASRCLVSRARFALDVRRLPAGVTLDAAAARIEADGRS